MAFVLDESSKYFSLCGIKDSDGLPFQFTEAKGSDYYAPDGSIIRMGQANTRAFGQYILSGSFTNGLCLIWSTDDNFGMAHITANNWISLFAGIDEST